MGLFDNYSIDEKTGRDYSKSPVFHMSAANGEEFDIEWNSESARNMVCTPHKDYIKNNAYLKKLFYYFEKQFLNRFSR